MDGYLIAGCNGWLYVTCATCQAHADLTTDRGVPIRDRVEAYYTLREANWDRWFDYRWYCPNCVPQLYTTPHTDARPIGKG